MFYNFEKRIGQELNLIVTKKMDVLTIIATADNTQSLEVFDRYLERFFSIHLDDVVTVLANDDEFFKLVDYAIKISESNVEGFDLEYFSISPHSNDMFLANFSLYSKIALRFFIREFLNGLRRYIYNIDLV